MLLSLQKVANQSSPRSPLSPPSLLTKPPPKTQGLAGPGVSSQEGMPGQGDPSHPEITSLYGPPAGVPDTDMTWTIDDEDTIVPTDAYAAQVCTDAGGAFDAETGACAPVYECFRGGYCSEAASRWGIGAEDGNLYDGHTPQGSGCDTTQDTLFVWRRGVGVAWTEWDRGQPVPSGRQLCR